SEAQAQGGSPRLAVGGEAPRSEVSDGELHVVAMRAHERRLADQLVGATFRESLLECRLERIPPEVRRVSAHEAVPRQALELLVGEWSELFDRGCASPDHRGPRLHELRVPGLELRRSAAPLPFLQQAVPLPERALVRAKL